MKFKVKRLVVGNSLEALLYAWRTQSKCLCVEPAYVFRFDKRLREYDFSLFNAYNPKHFQKNLLFTLSLTSLMLYPNNISSVRQEDDLTITVITKGNRLIRIDPDEVVFFDKETDMYDVYDFFNSREMTPHATSEIVDSDSDFVNRINFYNSPRVSNNIVRDMVTTSEMNYEQVIDPDYSPGIVKIKILRMMSNAGLKGNFNRQSGIKRYYKTPKIEFHKRIISQRPEPLYSFAEVYNMEQEQGEPWKILEMLRKPDETWSVSSQ